MGDRAISSGRGSVLILALLGTLFAAPTLSAQSHSFGIEINGVLCGYAEVDTELLRRVDGVAAVLFTLARRKARSSSSVGTARWSTARPTGCSPGASR